MNKYNILILAHLLVAVLFSNAAASTNNMTIKLSGMSNDKGKLMIQIVNSETDWKDENSSFKQQILPIEGGQSVWEISDLPDGTYAIRCYHDENGNEKLDTNLFGIPKEKYGFSNNVRGKISAPKWSEAHFELSNGQSSIVMEIILK